MKIISDGKTLYYYTDTKFIAKHKKTFTINELLTGYEGKAISRYNKLDKIEYYINHCYLILFNRIITNI